MDPKAQIITMVCYLLFYGFNIENSVTKPSKVIIEIALCFGIHNHKCITDMHN